MTRPARVPLDQAIREDTTYNNHVRALALREAANEVHIEARWQTERTMRGLPPDSLTDRLIMLERILLDRASALDQP